MNATASQTPADRFALTFEEMRATMAAEGPRKGLAGALQAAILRLLNTILALLAELRTGTLAAPASHYFAGSDALAIPGNAWRQRRRAARRKRSR
jgi:hypothetical protein